MDAAMSFAQEAAEAADKVVVEKDAAVLVAKKKMRLAIAEWEATVEVAIEAKEAARLAQVACEACVAAEVAISGVPVIESKYRKRVLEVMETD